LLLLFGRLLVVLRGGCILWIWVRKGILELEREGPQLYAIIWVGISGVGGDCYIWFEIDVAGMRHDMKDPKETMLSDTGYLIPGGPDHSMDHQGLGDYVSRISDRSQNDLKYCT